MKPLTLDDLEGYCQPVPSIILATAGLLVVYAVLYTDLYIYRERAFKESELN